MRFPRAGRERGLSKASYSSIPVSEARFIYLLLPKLDSTRRGFLRVHQISDPRVNAAELVISWGAVVFRSVLRYYFPQVMDFREAGCSRLGPREGLSAASGMPYMQRFPADRMADK